MPNQYDKNGMIHQWIYVIIPVQDEHDAYGPGHSKVPAIYPLFCAFCKGCRTYFTERMSVTSSWGSSQGPSSLPRYGCILPDDVPVLTPEMGLVV